MLELNSFFDGMSKQLLRAVHAKAFGHKGLLNNALIESEALSYFDDRRRASDLFSKMEPWQRRCMYLLYNSGNRGLTFNELRLTIPVTKNKELRKFLLDMCREFLLWRSVTGSATVYYGFSNFVGCFEMASEMELSPRAKFQSFQNLLDWHVCLVLSFAMKKELKLNTNGCMHRRGYQLCVEAFTSTRQMCEKAAENEVSLIFNFLIGSEWLEQEDSCLVPSAKALEFIRVNGFRLHQEIVSWWVKERFHGDRSHCVQLLKSLEPLRSAYDASYLLWVLDPTFRMVEKEKELPWDYLPRPLRELWLLGFVKFQIVDSKIAAVTLEQSGKDWVESSIASIPEQNISCLPNFELIISTGTSPRVLFMLACLAKVENDETFLRFSLNKDAYLLGLKCGFPEAEVENFKSWIKPPENVGSTLVEWNASYYGVKVRNVRLLKIVDQKVLNELSMFPQFTENTEEYIPGYGFILKQDPPNAERRALEILENYGYCPFAENLEVNRAAAPTEEWKKDFVIAWPKAKTPDYELKDDVDETAIQSTLDSTKYGSNYQKLSQFDLVKILRYAKTVGNLVGAKVKDVTKRGAKEEEKIFFVHALRLAKSPQVIEIQVYGKEERENLDLSFIQEVKVFNGKEI